MFIYLLSPNRSHLPPLQPQLPHQALRPPPAQAITHALPTAPATAPAIAVTIARTIVPAIALSIAFTIAPSIAFTIAPTTGECPISKPRPSHHGSLVRLKQYLR